VHNCKFIGDVLWTRCRPTPPNSLVTELGRRLAAGRIPGHSHPRTRCSLTVTFLTEIAVNADMSLLPFPMGDVWVFASTPDS
jgi:hypothetical protein